VLQHTSFRPSIFSMWLQEPPSSKVMADVSARLIEATHVDEDREPIATDEHPLAVLSDSESVDPPSRDDAEASAKAHVPPPDLPYSLPPSPLFMQAPTGEALAVLPHVQAVQPASGVIGKQPNVNHTPTGTSPSTWTTCTDYEAHASADVSPREEPGASSALQTPEDDEMCMLRTLVELTQVPLAATSLRVAAIRALAQFAKEEAQDLPKPNSVVARGWEADSRSSSSRGTHPVRTKQLESVGAVDVWCELCGPEHPAQIQKEAACALGSVAETCDGATEILVERGCINALVELLVDAAVSISNTVGKTSEANATAAQAALHALANQFANHGSLEAMVDEGVLDALVYLAGRGVDELGMVGESAGWLLCLLSTEPETSEEVIGHPGVLPALLGYGRSDSTSAQEETAWAFAALSAEPEPANLLADTGGSIELLLDLLGRSCAAVRLQAVWALANLSLHPVAAARLQSMPSILPLCLVLQEPDADGALLLQATRCLGSVLVTSEGRRQLLQLSEDDGVSGGALGALASLLRFTYHAEVGDAAIRSLVHAFAQPYSAAGRYLTVPGGVERLRELLLDSEDGKRQKTALAAVFQLSAALANSAASQDDEPDGTPCACNAKLLFPYIEPVVDLLAECACRQVRVQAAGVLLQMAGCQIEGESEFAFAQQIAQAGALAVLRRLALSRDEVLQIACCQSLEALTRCLTPQSRRQFAIGAPDSVVRHHRSRRMYTASPLGIDAPRVELACPGGITTGPLAASIENMTL